MVRKVGISVMFSTLSQLIKTVYSIICQIIECIEWNSKVAFSPLRTVVSNFLLCNANRVRKHGMNDHLTIIA